MASRPRSRNKRNWPQGLYERNGYFAWRNPVDSKEYGLGRIPEREAISQAVEANLAVQELLAKPRLVDRIMGKEDTSWEAWLKVYELKLGLVDGEVPDDAPPLAYNTKKSYRSIIKKIRDTYKESLGLSVDKVSTKTVVEGLNAVKKANARTAQAMRSRLLHSFDSAIAEGWTTQNPVTVTEDITVKVQRARMTWDVFKAAYDRCQVPSTKNTMALALVSGQPREVLAAALFSDCGPLERPGVPAIECWKLRRGKTGAMIAIPLDLRLNVFGMSLREVIAMCRSTKVVSKYMIHNATRRKGAKLGDPLALNRMTRDVSAAIEDLGIDWGKFAPPTLHEIRSLSKRLYKDQGGVDTKDLLGHKTEQMSELYADARGSEYKLVSVR